MVGKSRSLVEPGQVRVETHLTPPPDRHRVGHKRERRAGGTQTSRCLPYCVYTCDRASYMYLCCDSSEQYKVHECLHTQRKLMSNLFSSICCLCMGMYVHNILCAHTYYTTGERLCCHVCAQYTYVVCMSCLTTHLYVHIGKTKPLRSSAPCKSGEIYAGTCNIHVYVYIQV